MSVERNFSNYNLLDMPEGGVYGLAGNLLPEMAEGLGFDLGDQPNEESLRGFIGHIGPAKELQDNIALVQHRLGTDRDAVTLAADWVKRSGVMTPLERNFVHPEAAVPGAVDLAIITGGVARWMLRRSERLVEHVGDGNLVGSVLLVGGTRLLKPAEHTLVQNWKGEAPTEGQFMRKVVAKQLRAAGLEVDVMEPDTQNGDEVMTAATWAGGITSKSVLIVSNAPAGIQNAAQLRRAGRELPGHSDYDATGENLYVLTDTYPIARHGEPAATHQNPFTALGQIARNALMLHAEQAHVGA